MHERRWVPWLAALIAGAAACQLAVGNTDLGEVYCTQEQAVGPPACAAGQWCSQSVCTPCTTADCLGEIEGGAGTGGSTDGAGGGAGSAGSSTSGTGAAGGHDTGVPEAGSGGRAGNGGVGGWDASQEPVDDPPLPEAPDDPAPEEPSCPVGGLGGCCGSDNDCGAGTFCAPLGVGFPWDGRCTTACCKSQQCIERDPAFVCAPAYGGGVCVHKDLFSDVAKAEPLGTRVGAEGCSKPGDCQSGRCDGECVDMCCTDTDCAYGHCSLVGNRQRCVVWPNDHQGIYNAGCRDSVLQLPTNDLCTSNMCKPLSGTCTQLCCTAGACSGQCNYSNYWGGVAEKVCDAVMVVVEPCCTNAECGAKTCRAATQGLETGNAWVLRCE